MADKAAVEAQNGDTSALWMGVAGLAMAVTSWVVCAHLGVLHLASIDELLAQARGVFVLVLLAGSAMMTVSFLAYGGRAGFLLQMGVAEAFLAGSLHWWGTWLLAAPCGVATVAAYSCMLLSAKAAWPEGWRRSSLVAALVPPTRLTAWTDVLMVVVCATLTAGRIWFVSPAARVVPVAPGATAAMEFLLTVGSLLAMGTWVWLALDLWHRRKRLSDMALMGWFTAFLCLSVFGAMAYYLFVKRPELGAEGTGAGDPSLRSG